MILNYSDWKRLYEQSSYGSNPEEQKAKLNGLAAIIDANQDPINAPITKPGMIAVLSSTEAKPNSRETYLNYLIYYFNGNDKTVTGWAAMFTVTHMTDQYTELDVNAAIPQEYTVAPGSQLQPTTNPMSLTEAYIVIAGTLKGYGQEYTPDTYANALDAVAVGLKDALISSLKNKQGIWKSNFQNPPVNDPTYQAIKTWAESQS